MNYKVITNSKKIKLHVSKKLLLLFTFIFSLFALSRAQYTVLYNFNNSAGGGVPLDNLVWIGHNFYGMTESGAANGSGDIFRIDTNGSNYTDLFDFNGTSNGEAPFSTLLLCRNKFYGMTLLGGTKNDGVIFSVDTNGSNYTVLLNFDSANGKYPYGSLLLVRNKLYGMTEVGGANDRGLIFSIDTTGANYLDMLDFNGTNGGDPMGTLIVSNGQLFGMTGSGGANNDGIVFSMDTNGSNYKILLNFNVTNGQGPYASHLVLSNNMLYGMTENGGTGGVGVVFSIDTTGNNYHKLLDFNGPNGKNAPGSLSLAGKTLYGISEFGGASGFGNIFKIDTNGNNYADLHDLTGADGKYTFGSLTIVGNTVYGMTQNGGTNNDGVIFRYKDTAIITASSAIPVNSTQVALYPNPNNGTFQLQINNYELRIGGRVEIYNMLGEKVYSQKLSLANTELSIEQPAGIYLYRINDETGKLLGEGKFVIE